ncbi:hypothetical protein GCM10010121_054480 [Streptomyces brasiliensis]|uniref:Uncharacterized protein n=1 Tax=Streptomyces brasiliensis TaxID=1954 RepID=A0A917L2E0_9ACTN|nr:hypothetical protein GCM10010121_054480 [Streptomyces brasiliensis]
MGSGPTDDGTRRGPTGGTEGTDTDTDWRKTHGPGGSRGSRIAEDQRRISETSRTGTLGGHIGTTDTVIAEGVREVTTEITAQLTLELRTQPTAEIGPEGVRKTTTEIGPKGTPKVTDETTTALITRASTVTGTTTITRTTIAGVPELPPTPPPPPLPSLDQLPYEAYEFGRLEGLGEEGVDTGVESALHFVLRTGADDGEREITGPRVGTQPGGRPQPVEPGHHDVQGHDIGPHLMNHIKTLGTICRGHDLETLKLEIDPDQLPDDLVVVHNKHPTRRAWHNSRVGPHQPPRTRFPHFHPRERRSRPAPRKPVPDHTSRAGSVLPVAASKHYASDTPP